MACPGHEELKQEIKSLRGKLAAVSQLGPEVIKLFFMLNSVEHEILNAHNKNIKKNSAFFRAQIRMVFFSLINDKMPTIVGILTFMSRKNFRLN